MNVGTSIRQRGPGRPRGRAADRRARILETATMLFGERGIAATSISAVARAAHVTPALVHYYFGDREHLLDALVDERLVPLATSIEARMAAAGESPRELIRIFVGTLIEVVAANPWFPPLWVREVISDGGLLRERMMGQLALPIAKRLRDRLVSAKKEGSLNCDIDPRLLVVSLIGLTIFPFATASIWRKNLGAADITPDIMARHALALLERGLELPK
ncbi:MAG: TetR/AcrR family transcriptional regulator [Dokdonella sp.]